MDGNVDVDPSLNSPSSSRKSSPTPDLSKLDDEDVILHIAVGEMEYKCKNLQTIGPKGADGGWDGKICLSSNLFAVTQIFSLF